MPSRPLTTLSEPSSLPIYPKSVAYLSLSVVLVDLSMPVLDGIAATREIREIEAQRISEHEQQFAAGAGADSESPPPRSAKILALTGMSSLEDKRKAFEAGMDG